MNKISDIRLENRFNQDYLYNKRDQYATIFDDKKLVEYNYNQQNLNNNKNNSIIENDFQNYQLNRVHLTIISIIYLHLFQINIYITLYLNFYLAYITFKK